MMRKVKLCVNKKSTYWTQNGREVCTKMHAMKAKTALPKYYKRFILIQHDSPVHLMVKCTIHLIMHSKYIYPQIQCSQVPFISKFHGKWEFLAFAVNHCQDKLIFL